MVKSMGRQWTAWVFAGVAGLLQPAVGTAATFVDTFDGGVDPAWWVAGAEGGSAWQVVDGRVVMTQGAGGFAALSFVEAITGDFTVHVDYVLLDWPADNKERSVLNAYAGPAAQLLIERISDSQYDPTRVGEVYLTDFTGQGILGTPTSDRSGTLRLQRAADTVRGAFWDGADWRVIGSYAVAGEGAVPRTMGFGIFPGPTVTPGVRVAFDNFRLEAAALTVPEPGTASLWLLGLGLVALAGRRRGDGRVPVQAGRRAG